MKNIFLALDFEERSKALVEHAAKYASVFGAKVWVVHIAAPNPDFVGFEIGPQYMRNMRADDLRAEHRYLQEIAKTLESKGIEAESLLIQGPTVEMILEEAGRLKSDLILMGSHDHGLLHNMLLGSTAQGLLKKSKIPLLVIPV